MKPRFAVLGAGNGGHAMAADLSSRGFEVNFFELPKFKEAIEPAQMKGGIELISEHERAGLGKGSYFVKVNGIITTDIKKAIEDVDVLMVVVPAFAHKVFAEICAPYLVEDQIIVLNPGSCGGALEFGKILRDHGVRKAVTIAETTSLFYACRRVGSAQVKIHAVKNEMPIASLPAREVTMVIRTLGKAFPQLVPATNALETGLNRPGMLFHPVSMLLNIPKVEQGLRYGGPYDVTPSLAKIMETVDKERLSVAKTLGVRPVSTVEWLHRSYGAKGDTLYEALTDCYVYKFMVGETLPSSLQFRYVTEDVPYQLVPVSSFGDLLGVNTPLMKSLVQIASVVNQTDYWKEGRTLDKMGLSGLKTKEIIKYVTSFSLDG
jgi:opine dehydrogenase